MFSRPKNHSEKAQFTNATTSHAKSGIGAKTNPTSVPFYIGLLWVMVVNLVIGGGIIVPPPIAAAAASSVNSDSSNKTASDSDKANSTSASAGASTTSKSTNQTLQPATAAQATRARQAFSRLPLAFEVNAGQSDDQVRYLARGQGYSMFFTDDGTATLDLRKSVPNAALASSSAGKGNGNGRGPKARGTNSNEDNNFPVDPTLKDEDGLTQAQSGLALSLKLLGANKSGQPVAEDRLATASNYFNGNDPAKWQTGIVNYSKLTYKEVYKGIDLSYTGQQEQLEYQFTVAPGADVSQIAFQFEGVNAAKLEKDGSLTVRYGAEKLTQAAPTIYQLDPVTGQRQLIEGGFTLVEKSATTTDNAPLSAKKPRPGSQTSYQIGFKLTGSYDHSRPVVIDPVLAYSSFIGGVGIDSGQGIKVDASGNAYVTGYTLSSDFPTTSGAYQTSYNSTATSGGYDAFVTKLNSTGTALVYSTYLGGTAIEEGLGLDLYSDGQVYITGMTDSADFPTTSGAYSTTLAVPGLFSMFVARLSATGTLNYSTLIGGDGGDFGRAIVVNPTNPNLIYVAGEGFGNVAGFPTTSNAITTTKQGDHFDGIILQLDLSKTGANQLVYSSYFGGNGEDVIYALAVDTVSAPRPHFYISGYTTSTNLPVASIPASGFGPIYRTTKASGNGGTDSFLAIIGVPQYLTQTTNLLYSTYLGGTGDDQANGISLDAYNNVYIVGQTYTNTTTHTFDYPTTSNALKSSATGATQQAFLTVFSPTQQSAANQLLYSTYLGGSGSERGLAVVADHVAARAGQVYVSGVGNSTDLITTTGQPIPPAGVGGDHAFVMKLDTTKSGSSSLVYSLRLAGSTQQRERASAIALDSSGNAYVTGYTTSPDFTTTVGAFQTTTKDNYDAFVTKLGPTGAVSYSTYLGGGSPDTAGGVAVGSDGSFYLAGQTNAAQFPTTTGSTYPNPNAPAPGQISYQDTHLFAVRLAPDGSGLMYSTLIGGSGADAISNGAAVDANGNFVFTGYTTSTDFPTTSGAYQTSYGTGVTFKSVLLKLGPSGLISYSTYFGGNNSTVARAATTSPDGSRLYIAGATSSDAAAFPLKGAYQTSYNGSNDGFLAVFNPAGSGTNDLVNSTLFGGSGTDQINAISLDGLGGIYVAGFTGLPANTSIPFPTTTGAYQTSYSQAAGGGTNNAAFVSKFTTSGSTLSLAYSTLLGGNLGNQVARGVVADSGGNAYVLGFTTSSNFPTSGTAYQKVLSGTNDLFVTKFNSNGSALTYSTLVGGNGSENCPGSGAIALDTQVISQVVGVACTTSTNFPTTPAGLVYQANLAGGNDAVAFKLNPTGSGLVYSTYLGGSKDDQAMGVGVDRLGNIYVGGNTASTNFPTTFGAYQAASQGGGDVFAAKLSQVKLVFTTQPVGGPANSPLTTQPVVQVYSSVTNTPLTAYNGPVTLTLKVGTGTSGASLGGTTVVNAVNGVATFTNLSVNLAGTGYVLTAKANLIDPVDSAPFNVGAAAGQPASIVVYSGSGQSAQVSTTFAAPLVAQVLDAYNNPVSGAVVTFTAPVSPTSASGTFTGGVSSATATTIANGTATAPAFTANGYVGSYVVTATVAGVTTPASFTLTNTAQPLPTLVFTQQPDGAVAGSVFITQPVLAVLNPDSSLDTAYNGPVTVTIASGTGTSGASLGGTVVLPIVSGVVTYTDLSIDLAGTAYRLTAQTGNLAPATSAPFNVGGGGQATLFFQTQPGAAQAGLPFGTQPVVVKLNADGTTDTTFNAPITISLVPNTGSKSANLYGPAVVTAQAGVANFSGLYIDNIGSGYVLSATTVDKVGLPAVASAPFNVEGDITGIPASIVVKSGSNQSITTTQPFLSPLVAQVVDANGAPVTTPTPVTFTVVAGSNLAGATFSNNGGGTVAALTSGANGLVSLSGVTANSVAGNYVVRASLGSGAAGNFVLNNINPSDLAQGVTLTLVPVLSGPNSLGSTVTLTATLTRHYVTPLANQPITLTITSDVVAPVIVPLTTDVNGTATYSYTRSIVTTDTVSAIAVVGGVTVSAVPTSTIYWYTPTAQLSTDSVTGLFFHVPDTANLSDFSALTPTYTALFTQTFPTLLFEPPYGSFPNQSIGPNTFPFMDAILDSNGNEAGAIIAQGNGYTAGIGALGSGNGFDAVFRGNLVVAAAGPVTFGFYVDNYYQVGIGTGDNGQQPVNLNDPGQCPAIGRTPPATTPYYNYPLFNAYYGYRNEPDTCVLTVNFPAPGKYPFEVDFYQDSVGQEALSLFQQTATHAVGGTGALTLAPLNSTAPIFTSQSFTAQILDAAKQPVANTQLAINITGANTQSFTVSTDNNGTAVISYQGYYVGTDQIQATGWARGVVLKSNVVNITWTAGAGGGNPPVCQILSGWVLTPTVQAVITGQSSVIIANGVTLPATTIVQIYPSDQPDVAHTTTLTQLSADFTGDGHTALTALDSTKLANGSYILRIAYNDSQGCHSSLTPFIVVGENKPGRVTFSLTDLTVPLAGLPIVVGRTYDSLERNILGDFGYGWRLSVDGPRLSVDPAGNVTLDTLDGKRVTFYFTPNSPSDQDVQFLGQTPINVFSYLQIPFYTPEPGAYGRLRANNKELCGLVTPAGAAGYVCFLGPVYLPNIESYTYTDPAGREFTIAASGPRKGKLESIKDLQGNLLTFDDNGVRASGNQGALTGFQGDSYLVRFGRRAADDATCPNCIKAITDTMGNVYKYDYGSVTESNGGDLTSLTLPLTTTTTPITYTYYTTATLAHFFKGAYDPRGNTMVTTQYYDSGADQGRLKSVTQPVLDGAGGNTNATYTTSYSYDITNNLTLATNPDLGQTSSQTDNYGKVISETDALGRSTNYVYDAKHNAITTKLPSPTTGLPTSPDSRVMTATYDVRGNKTGEGDPLGHTTSTAYDLYSAPLAITDQIKHTYNVGYGQTGPNSNGIAYELPTSVSDGLGSVGGYSFDDRGSVLSRSDGEGRTTSFTYDSYGNKASETDALGHTTLYQYDTLGRMVAMTDTFGVVSKYAYDALGRLQSSIVAFGTPHSQQTTYTYDANGNKTSETDALNHTTYYGYDSANRMTVITYADGNTQHYGYDWRGNKVSETNQRGFITRHLYDTAGQMISTTVGLNSDGSANADTATMVVEYDKAGRKVKEYNAYSGAGTLPANQPSTSYVYDAAGRLTKLTNQVNDDTTFGYDEAGRQTSQTVSSTLTTYYHYDVRGHQDIITYPVLANGTVITTGQQYDLAGNIVARQDGAGKKTTYFYDLANRLSTVTNPLGQPTGYTYDDGGRLAVILDANGHSTRMVYDEQGRPVAKVWPGGNPERYTYDSVGNLTGQTLADQTTTNNFVYDGMNRLVTGQYGYGTTLSRTVAYTYTKTGQKKTINDTAYAANGTESFVYDSRDRLVQATQPSLGSVQSQQVGYSYDANSNRLSLLVTATNVVSTTSYAYDNANRVQRVTGPNDPAGSSTTYSYFPTGLRNQANLANGVTVQYWYDNANRLTDLVQFKGVSSLATYKYAMDGAGNRTAITETVSYGGSSTRKMNYNYDGADRVISETDTAGSGFTNLYGYDGTGNRQAMTVTLGANNSVTRYSYNQLDQLTSYTGGGGTGNYNYDKRGNLVGTSINGVSSAYTWDSANRLINVSVAGGTKTASYMYDAEGHRVQQSVSGQPTTDYLWDSLSNYGDVVLETNGSNGQMQTSYVLNGVGGDLISQQRAGQTSADYYLKDGQGSVRALLDNGGALVQSNNQNQSYGYSAFGNLLKGSPSGAGQASHYLYTGQQYDSLTGLYDLRARYYNPADGRFLSQDTWPINLRNPTELNRYGYTANNPINSFDPTGNWDYMLALRNSLKAVAHVFVALAVVNVILLTTFMIIDIISKLTGSNGIASYEHDPNARVSCSGKEKNCILRFTTADTQSIVFWGTLIAAALIIIGGLIVFAPGFFGISVEAASTAGTIWTKFIGSGSIFGAVATGLGVSGLGSSSHLEIVFGILPPIPTFRKVAGDITLH